MLSKVREELERIERHIRILKLVIENEPIGIIKLSEITGWPQHKVRYSLRVLEQNGLIKPSPRGAITTELARKFYRDLPKVLDELEKKIEAIKKEIS